MTKGDGTPFKIYTAFYRAWAEHGWRQPAASRPGDVTWRAADGTGIPADPDLPAGLTLPEAGEAAALAAWHLFRRSHPGRLPGVNDYWPDLDRQYPWTSPDLKLASIHPRDDLPWIRACGFGLPARDCLR